MSTFDKAAALAILSTNLQAIEAGAGPDSDAALLLDATINYIESTQPLADKMALAEVAYAFVAGYEHATGNTDAARPVFVALRSAGLSL